jgi:hypothetical protein
VRSFVLRPFWFVIVGLFSFLAWIATLSEGKAVLTLSRLRAILPEVTQSRLGGRVKPLARREQEVEPRPKEVNLTSRIASDVTAIIRAGASMVVTASHYKVSDLENFAAAARSVKASLIVMGASSIITSDMVRIAGAGSGHVVLVEEALPEAEVISAAQSSVFRSQARS